MKKILVALTFLSLLFCGSQAYALDTGNAVVTNDTIGSDSGIKAPDFALQMPKAILLIFQSIKQF